MIDYRDSLQRPANGSSCEAAPEPREVVATLDDNWFLPWWPSEGEPIRIDLHTVGDELLASLDLGDRYVHEPSCKVYFLDRLCLWR